MDAPSFLKRAGVQRAVRRAARVAQTAVAVHAHDGTGESARVTGCGNCAAACAYVQTLPWGRQACRRSRAKHARLAIDRGRPVPFLCHMGFACVAAPVLPGSGSALALTLGPFCPAEAPNSLEQDARDGLEQLEHTSVDQLPFTLGDIPLVPASVPGDVAEWLSETLMEQWNAASTGVSHGVGTAVEARAAEKPESVRHRGSARVVRDDYGARAIYAAMAGGSSAEVRRAVLDRIAPSRRRASVQETQSRALAVAAAAIECAERAGTAPIETRRRLAALPASLAEVDRPKAACALVLKTLAPIRRQLLRNDRVTADFFTRLGRYVREHLDDDLRLLAVASDLGLAPSTVTRRLERRYGLTFTGYVARQRVERAKSMLQRTGLSVEIIARRVGLTDSAHLRKLLQRFDGVSPSQVRAKRPTRRAAG